MNGLVKKMPALLTSMSTTFEASYRRLEDLGGSRGLSDVTVHQSDLVGSRNFGGLRHVPRIGNDVETPFDERLHDPRADPLRSSGHDGCLPWAAHSCSLTSKIPSLSGIRSSRRGDSRLRVLQGAFLATSFLTSAHDA